MLESWNGKTWRSWFGVNLCGGPPGTSCGFADVSCGSAANCVAVGTTTFDNEGDQGETGVAWTGKTWVNADPPGNGDPAVANAVGCYGGFCMAAGGAYQEVNNGDVATAGAWNARTMSFRDVSPNLGVICTGYTVCTWAGPMACGSPSNCMTFTGSYGNLAWNGRKWIKAPSLSAGQGSLLDAVSCDGPDCLAVGYRTIRGLQHTLAELWNGKKWRILATPTLP